MKTAVITLCLIFVFALAIVPSAFAKSYPAQLSIPSINTAAAIQAVGLARDGSMAVPTAPGVVGWYAGGAVPGAIGSAVLDAHVYLAFKKLKNIAVGESVYVTMQTGARLHFVVTRVKNYPIAAVPLDALFNAADASHLNLITCSGKWLPAAKTYDHRLVVYAELVS